MSSDRTLVYKGKTIACLVEGEMEGGSDKVPYLTYVCKCGWKTDPQSHPRDQITRHYRYVNIGDVDAYVRTLCEEYWSKVDNPES